MDKRVAFLFDRKNSWIYKFFRTHKFDQENYTFSYLFDADEVCGFDVVFLLGYTAILSDDFLQRNSLNLVVHESKSSSLRLILKKGVRLVLMRNFVEIRSASMV